MSGPLQDYNRALRFRHIRKACMASNAGRRPVRRRQVLRDKLAPALATRHCLSKRFDGTAATKDAFIFLLVLGG